MHIYIYFSFSRCVCSWQRSEQASGSRWREGAGFRASSAAHGLTNYLWNCCIHSHLNRNLSERRRGPASPQRTAKPPAPPPPQPPCPPPSFFSCLSKVSLFLSLCLLCHSQLAPSSLSPILWWWIDPNANLQPFYMSMPPPRPAAGT